MAQAEVSARKGLLKVDAQTVKDWQAAGRCLLVDVREPKEFAASRIPGSVSMPLSSFDPAAVVVPEGQQLVVHCQAGMRANDAARRLLKLDHETVWCFEGGMNEWTAAGFATEGTAGPAGASCGLGSTLTVQRQMQLIVGSMIAVFTLLGLFVDARLGSLCLIPAAGLINAGLTGLCPLVKVVSKLPWNK